MATKISTNDLKFGIEIETIGLTTRDAAQVVADAIGGTVEYNGAHSHFPGRAGYDTWFAVMTDGRKWNVVPDSSLSGGYRSAEVTSPILGSTDMDALQTIVRALRTAGATVDESCGIHVHVGIKGVLTASGIGRLSTIVYRRDAMITSALGIETRRGGSYCKTMTRERVEAIRGATSMRKLADAWYGCNDGNGDRHGSARTAPYHGSRYHGLNLHSVFFRGTAEFRWFRGSLHAGEVRAYVTLCLGLVAMAANQSGQHALESKPVSRTEAVRWVKKWISTDEVVLTHLTARCPG
jgi:hypothetical protein